MHWKDAKKTPPPASNDHSELPAELVAGIREIASKGTIQYVRLRTWPRDAMGFVKWANLEISAEDQCEPLELARKIAAELAAAARFCWEDEDQDLEPKFEAQVVYRGGEAGKSLEKSITFRMRTTATTAATARPSMVEAITGVMATAKGDATLAVALMAALMLDTMVQSADKRDERREGQLERMFVLHVGSAESSQQHAIALGNLGFGALEKAMGLKLIEDSNQLERLKLENKSANQKAGIELLGTLGQTVIASVLAEHQGSPAPATEPSPAPAPAPAAEPSPSPAPAAEPSPAPAPAAGDLKAERIRRMGLELRRACTPADLDTLERFSPAARAAVEGLGESSTSAEVADAIGEVLGSIPPLKYAELANALSPEIGRLIPLIMTARLQP